MIEPVQPTFTVSNDLLDDPPALRQRLGDDGYLFFRGVGPKDKILAARRDVLRLCHDAGWWDLDGNRTCEGPFTEGDPQYMAVYKHVIKLPSFLAVPEDAAMMDVMAKVLDAPPLLHRLRIGRITFPNNVSQTTAAHQDHWYIRGAEATYTIWTPLGDCPQELGGLAVLPGSHRAGFIEHGFDSGKKYAGHGLSDERLPTTRTTTHWVTNDFQVGDFVLFHSLTIHKVLPNLSMDRLRISTDNRYQRAGDPIAEVSKGTHYNL